MSARPQAVLLAVVLSVLPVPGADFTMKVTDSGYLDTQGFSVILYHSTYDRTFVDQKNTAMEMILHDEPCRSATDCGAGKFHVPPLDWLMIAIDRHVRRPPILRTRTASPRTRRAGGAIPQNVV